MEKSRLMNIRWVHEDALKFVVREERRGNKYDAIIMDPPAWGLGAKGERWKLEDQIVVIFEYMFGSNLDEYLIELKSKLIEFLKPLTQEIVGKNRFDHTRHSHIKYAGISAGPARDLAEFLKRDVSEDLRTSSFLGAPKGAQIYQYILKGMMFNGGTDGPVCLLYNPKKDVQITQVGKINNKDVRTFEFTTSDKSSLPNKLRWNILDTTIKTLNPVETNTGKLSPIRIQIKQFYDVSPTQSVFAACKLIDNQIKTNQLEYETDGFIFTPKKSNIYLSFRY